MGSNTAGDQGPFLKGGSQLALPRILHIDRKPLKQSFQEVSLMSADVQPASALPEFTRWLAGSERPRPASHKHIEPLHPDEAVTFMLILRRRPGTVPSPQIPFDGPSSISREEYVQ